MTLEQIQIKSELSELRKLRKFAEDFYQDVVDETELYRILLVLEEAVSNIILHGYKNFEDGIIQIELGYSEKEILICIKDSAPFFDGNQLQLNLQGISKNLHSGLGIFIMRKIMKVEYKPREGGGNCLYMKRINYSKKK